jgi:hypothetical protein
MSIEEAEYVVELEEPDSREAVDEGSDSSKGLDDSPPVALGRS